MYIFHLRLLDKGPKTHNTLLLAIPHKFPAEAWPKVEFIIQIRARDLKFHLQISNQDLLYHDLHITYSIRNDGDKYLKIAFLAQMPYVNIKPKKKTGLKFLAVDVCQRKHLQEMGESLISMSDLSYTCCQPTSISINFFVAGK